MRVTVICLREKGRPIPRWRISRLPTVTGRLVVEDKYHATIHRTVRIARMVTESRDNPCPLPELVDVQLLWVREDGIAIGGFEEILEIHYAQTWLARPAE
jgi:hypothetical protein